MQWQLARRQRSAHNQINTRRLHCHRIARAGASGLLCVLISQ